jgi:hypothetical protein
VAGYSIVDWGVKLVGVSAKGVVETYKDVCVSTAASDVVTGVIVTVPRKVDDNEEVLNEEVPSDEIGTLSCVG